MTELDKLIAQADRLEGVRGTIVLHDMDQAAIIAHLDALIEPIRALAAQQPEAVEPVAWMAAHDHKYLTAYKPLEDWWIPLYIHPQASAPADHTAEVIATPPYFCSDGDRCHNLLNEALCAKQCQRLMPSNPSSTKCRR